MLSGIADCSQTFAGGEVLPRLKGINTSFFFSAKETLQRQLQDVRSMELAGLLHAFVAESLQEGLISDPLQCLDRVATVVPLDALQEAAGSDAWQSAKEMFGEAQIYLNTVDASASTSWSTRFSLLLDALISVVDSIISAFGIATFFKPAESEVHADFKSSKIMMLLHLCNVLVGMVAPFMGNPIAGLIVGGTLLAISALSLIWPYIRPCTTFLPGNADNLTQEVQQYGCVAQGRKASLDAIANIMQMQRHAILVGPSRVGKSLTAKAFAQAVARGDYPELQGKVVFRVNTVDILGQQAYCLESANSVLSAISAKMGRHRDNIILVLDEIHMACKHKSKVADQLKTFLDERGAFPHVIGITTDEEYEQHVRHNHAFSMRFDKVEISNMSKDETLSVLADTLLRSTATPIIREGVLEYIYDKSMEDPEAAQPAAALKLLKQCINKTLQTQQSPLQQRIAALANSVLALQAQAAAGCGRNRSAAAHITAFESERHELQQQLQQQQQQLGQLFQAKQLLQQVTKDTYATVLKIAAVGQQALAAQEHKPLKLFLLLHEFLGKALQSRVEAQAAACDVRVVIDAALVDEVASTTLNSVGDVSLQPESVSRLCSL